MKRSQMIEKLARLLHEKDIDDKFMHEDDWYDAMESYRDNAETILDELERLGMLPPSKSGWKNNPIAQEFCTWNEWEPENE